MKSRILSAVSAARRAVARVASRLALVSLAAALVLPVLMPQPAQAAGDKTARFNGAIVITNDLTRDVTLGTVHVWQDNTAHTQTLTITRTVITPNTAFNTNANASVTNTVTLGAVTMTATGYTNLVLNYSWPDGGRLTFTPSDLANTNTYVLTRPEVQ